MTDTELEALRDSLIGFDTLLDALGTRVAVLEGAAVPKGTYFTQMIASFQDAPTCNEIIPTADPIDYLEIVAGTDEIYLGIQFGGYIAARNFILSAAHPHTAFAGNLQGFVAGTVITVTQIKAVSLIEAVIATISFDANGPTFVWSSPDVAVLVDDVLRFELTAYVEGCTNIEITLIGRFPRYILG